MSKENDKKRYAFNIITGARKHNFKLWTQTIWLPNLPLAFDGIKIGQLSDIHAGSFYNKVAVKGGIEMLLAEKPDLIFFTGDLVNQMTEEIKKFFDVFALIKAPLGVYSVLGNHDYGDYFRWPSQQAKVKNLKDMITAQNTLGWDLLLNENRIIEYNGEKIAIVGVENWGKGKFVKYGNIEEAYKGTEDAAVRLLLSHDPSHWSEVVLKGNPDIDITFSGHTHGFQFGIEVPGFRWSPSKYKYKHWAGLYTMNDQHLYVNRGYGYLGVTARIGIMPEISVFELKSV